MLTPLERAEAIVARHHTLFGQFAALSDLLVDWIREAIIEATNAEVEKRRAAEAECARLRRIVDALSRVDLPSPAMINATEKSLRLVLKNPITGDDWSVSFTKEGEVGHG